MDSPTAATMDRADRLGPASVNRLHVLSPRSLLMRAVGLVAASAPVSGTAAGAAGERQSTRQFGRRWAGGLARAADERWRVKAGRAHVRMVVAVVAAVAICAALLPAGTATAADVARTGAATARTDYGPVKARLSRYIRSLMAENRTAGLAIALVDGPRVVWARGFGLADVAARKRATADTVFHIGSATKTFTAAAVMQLVERGLVDLDAPLSRYVPGFSLRKRFPGRNLITVRSVLDHHSGIPGTLPKGMITTGEPDPGYTDYMLRRLRSLQPTSRVNVVGAYDNSGYVLLGRLIERVTGLGLEAYAQRYLFGPMGMSSSNYDDRRAPAARLSRNYQATYSRGKPVGLDD
jgi:CubicO group peptidase (beta-lactamase class C family)